MISFAVDAVHAVGEKGKERSVIQPHFTLITKYGIENDSSGHEKSGKK